MIVSISGLMAPYFTRFGLHLLMVTNPRVIAMMRALEHIADFEIQYFQTAPDVILFC